jgi:hypothetical protein
VTAALAAAYRELQRRDYPRGEGRGRAITAYPEANRAGFQGIRITSQSLIFRWYRHPGSNGGPLDPQSCG